MEEFLVTVVTPLYNRFGYIDETIESVINQTYTNWELIIVDDGSTDGSYERAIQWRKDYARKIKVYKRDRGAKGAPTCRNIGIKHASGTYIIFLDSDDVLAPGALEQRINILAEHPEQEMLVTPCLAFDDTVSDASYLWNVDDSDYSDLDRLLMLDVPWQTTSVTWKTEAILSIGKWDENLLSFQDWELNIRAIASNFSYLKLGLPDCFWRQASAKRHTIGNNSISKLHLSSHLYLLVKVTNDLTNKNLLTHFRKTLLIQLYFWFFNIEKQYNKFNSIKNLNYLFSNLTIPFFLRVKLNVIALMLLYKKLDYIRLITLRILNIKNFHRSSRAKTWLKVKYNA